MSGNGVRADDPAAFAEDVDRLTAGLRRGSVVANVPNLMHSRWKRDALGAAAVMSSSAQRRGLAVVDLHAARRHESWAAMLTQTGSTGATGCARGPPGKPSRRRSRGRHARF